MTNKEYENLLLAIQKYKNICISIELYSEFLSNSYLNDKLIPSSDHETFRLGLYGKIDETRIYVSRLCKLDDKTDFYIRISDLDEISIRNNIEAKGWSLLLKLEDFDRLNDLKAFW